MLVGTKSYGLYESNHTLSIVYCGTYHTSIITKLMTHLEDIAPASVITLWKHFTMFLLVKHINW